MENMVFRGSSRDPYQFSADQKAEGWCLYKPWENQAPAFKNMAKHKSAAMTRGMRSDTQL